MWQLVLCILVIGNFAFAQDKEAIDRDEMTLLAPTPSPEPTLVPVPTPTPVAVAPVEGSTETAQEYRSEKFGIGVNYSPIDMWIPSKFGANLTYNSSPKYSYELEYLSGAISSSVLLVDLGKITDKRISLLQRSFNGRRSFNYFWGAYYQEFEVNLGDDYLSTVSGAPASSVDLMAISNIGATWGFGNRWQAKHFTLGVDWLVINVPIKNLKSEADFITYSTDAEKRENARDAIEFFEKFPTLAAFKFQLGLAF